MNPDMCKSDTERSEPFFAHLVRDHRTGRRIESASTNFHLEAAGSDPDPLHDFIFLTVTDI